ncbi:MAG TPA: ABC transporter permease [Nevskiaceae bacterium]|nr:ABC transporter permease [Nevskiaceae bacterium]
MDQHVLAQQEVIIDGRSRGLIEHLGEVLRYRELLLVFAARDVAVRYKQTVLGAAWAILQPLVTMIVFSIVFGRLAKIDSNGYPYSIFVFSGLLGWIFFSSALSATMNSVLKHAHLINKVYFPRLILPFSAVGSTLLDCMISFGLLFVLMAWYGVMPSPSLLLAPVAILFAAITAIGAGSLLAALVVTYRDFAHVQAFLVYLWLFVTPVIYPVSYVDAGWRHLAYLNPMTGVVDLLRFAILKISPDPQGLAISAATALVLLVAGTQYFLRMERRFADVI